VLERVVVADREVTAFTWTPPVRPFFESGLWYPQGVSSTRVLSDDDDVLAWYVA